MLKQFVLLLTSSAILLIVDVLYLYNIGMKTFQKNVLLIQKTPLELNIYGALLSYTCVIGVLYYFIISQHRSILDAFLLGVFVYGTFDMTNKAMFTKYAWTTAIVDTIWGGTLFAITTWTTYALLK